jgi:hypothetical protein
LTLPWPLRLPLLIFVLSTQRQYEAELPTAGKRRTSPVSSVIVCGRLLQTLLDGLLQRFDLLAQAVKHREAARDGQHLVSLRKQALKCGLRQLANPCETETRTGIAYQDISDAHIGFQGLT